MLIRRSLPLLATLLGLTMAAPAVAAPVFPPGQRVGLEPVADLRPSTRFAGFEDVDRKVLVTIGDLPGAAYDQIAQSVFGGDPSATGITREDFEFAGGKGILVSGASKDEGRSVRRWFLIAPPSATETSDLTALIRIEVPEDARTTYSDATIRKLLASVSFRKVTVDELLGLLPFKLTDLAGFRVAKVVPGSVVVTDGPGDDMATQAFAVVTMGRAPPDRMEDRGRFARDLLAATPVRDLTVTSAEPMRISGTSGYEIRAKAQGATGEPITLVQWIRFGGGGFVGIVGIARNDDWDAMFNRFRALRDGVEIQ